MLSFFLEKIFFFVFIFLYLLSVFVICQLFNSLNGSTSIHATCDANGNWSDLVVHKTIECVPVTCSDPGNVQTARRFPESVRDPIYGYGTIFQYQCNSVSYV